MFNKFCPVASLQYLLILLLCMGAGDILAQGRAGNNWIFSNGQWVQFNFSDDTLADQTLDIPFEGGEGSAAVATDPVSGEVLFYTDGGRLYDTQGQAFGPNLGGDVDGNQEVVIAPVPGDDRSDGVLEYYVYVNVNGTVQYYTVSVNVGGSGFPAATVAGGPTNTGVTNVSGPMIVIPGEDTYYVVAQEANSATYRVIDAATGTPATYNLLTQNANAITANSLTYNEATGQIAVASNQGVQIVNFNPATGEVDYENRIGGVGNAYDVAWSADGSKLYISTGGGIRQYDVEGGQLQPIAGITNAFGLKQGPDGSIYYLYEEPAGEFKLGRIVDADSAANLVSNETALFDGTDFGGPRFSETTPGPTPEYALSVKQVGQCANNPVQLVPEFPAGTPDPDSMVWYIGEQTFRGTSPTITPEQSTSVGVIAYWGGDSVVVSGGVQVQDFQLQVPLVQDTTICPGEMTTLSANPDSGGGQGGGGGIPGGGGGTGGGGSYSYYWSTGATTDTIQVNEAGVYWVLVTDQSTGCTAYAESNVKEYQVLNQTYNMWYFGNGAGIDFNTLYDPDNPQGGGQITPLGDGVQAAPEGVASVSDPNGDILFYTDGQTVYFKDRVSGDHVQVPIADPPGAQGIGGDPTATQTAIVPVPNSDGVYYIFTTTEVENGGYALRYSIFDLRQQQVVSSNNLLFTKSTERIAIFGGDGSNAVLIAHEYGNNTFRAYPITSEGIGQPVTSSVGSVHSYTNPEEAEGYMKIGGDSTGTVVAVAVDGRVELFNFDLNTLKLSEPASVDLPGDRQGYGVEIVADTLGNTVVYVTTNDGIYAATIDRPMDEDEAPNMVQVSGTGGQAFGAIQQGSDGQIYVARPGASNLGVLSPNPNNPSQSGYNAEGIPGGLPNGATSGLGLPSEVRMGGNAFPEPGISVGNACVGGEVNFTAQGRDDVIETYFWEIIRLNEDGTRSNIGIPDSLARSQTFDFAIDTLGNFLAQVTLSNPCDEDSVMTQEFVMNNGIDITLPESVNLCNGTVDVSAIDPADDDGTLTFEWVQVGAVGGGNLPNQNTITIDEEATYQVTVTTAEGCVSTGEVFVVDNRPEVELPNDFTLCVGDTRELDVEIPSPADPGYEWVILDNNSTQVSTSNEPVIEVTDLTPNPGIYLYTVTVTDDSPEGCFVQDTVVVTILEAPEVVVSTLNTMGCQLSDGGAKVTFPNGEDPSQYTYTWIDSNGDIVGTGQILGQDPDDPNLNPNIPSEGVPAGVYTVTISTPNGCTIQRTAAIEDEFANFSFVATPSGNSGCDDNEGIIDVVIDDANNTDVFDVTWTLSGDTLIQDKLAGDDFTITNLSAGTYHLEIRSDAGCLQIQDNIVIPPVGPANEVQFNAPRQVNACGVSADLVVDFNINWEYSWYRPDGTPITEGQPGADSIRVTESGVYTVEVSDPTNPGLCPGSREINVNIQEPFNVNIRPVEPDNSCQTGERQLTIDFEPATAEGRDLIYTWTLDGNPLPNAGRTITVTQSGDYGVRVRERNTACFATDEEPVDVNQPITATIFFTQGCDDGAAIPLFASVRTTDTGPLEYAWFDPEGNRIPASNSVGDSLLVRSDMPEGQYSVRISTEGGCTAEALAAVRRNPVPEINFEGNRFTICSEDPDPEVNSVELSVGPAPEIIWTLPNGSQLFNTPTVIADEGGTYTVEMTNAYGCTITDSVVVVDDCRPRIVAPNAFRPGGQNNEFFVYHRYVAEDGFEVQIYNRWGELVYQSNDRDFRWDGTYKGREAPLGTYPYVIRFKSSTGTDENGKVYEERGGVTVLR